VMLDEVFSSKMIPVNDAARYTGTSSEMASNLNVKGKKIDKQKCVVLTITRIGIIFPMPVRHTEQWLTLWSCVRCGYICEEKVCIYIYRRDQCGFRGKLVAFVGSQPWLPAYEWSVFACNVSVVQFFTSQCF
jgi:hypothetical protein